MASTILGRGAGLASGINVASPGAAGTASLRAQADTRACADPRRRRRLLYRLGLLLAGVLLGTGAVGCQQVARETPEETRVAVGFENVERYTDVKTRYDAFADAAVLEDLRAFVQREAGRRLGRGQTLNLTFTDIDLAGDFEPFRGPAMMDVRVVNAIYPPRLEFIFALSDDSGAILKEGRERLTDMGFLMADRMPVEREDPLHFEKQLLRRWIARTLR